MQWDRSLRAVPSSFLWIIHVFAVLLLIGRAYSTFRAQSNPYNSTLRLIP